MNEPIIEYREEFNVFDIARKHAERIARVVDEQTLANVEDQLAGYGYVKVVRCRDCKHIVWTDNPMTTSHYWCIENDRPCALDDFCSIAERRENGGIESIYDWLWVRERVGEEEAERRKEQQREEERDEA